MIVQSATYTSNGGIEIFIDGVSHTLSNDPHSNSWATFQRWLDGGNTVSPFVPPASTVDDVRLECERRLMVLVGARDAKHLAIIKSNGQEEASALMWIVVGGGQLTTEQNERAIILSSVREAFEKIRSASNVLEAMIPIPENYADDMHWTE